MAKNKPGAQPGNTNALKHGYYASAVKGGQIRGHLERAIALQDALALQHEIALARAQLSRLLQEDPVNHDIMVRVMNTITRMIATSARLSRNEEGELGAAMVELLAELMPDKEI